MSDTGGAHPPRREVYVYWKLERPALPAALQAVRAFQLAVATGWPGLQARALVRSDEAGHPTATLMETYALPGHRGGVGDGLLAQLREHGDLATAPWRVGARHFEVFSEAPDA